LTDGEQEEEREETLYIEPFVQNLDDEASPQVKQDPDQKKEARKND
jgi:hypothetical protein